MSSTQTLRAAPSLNPTQRGRVLTCILAVEILLLCIPAVWWLYAGLSVAVVIVLCGLLISVLRDRAAGVVLAWVLVFPLGYYYGSYPRTEPLFTLDRLFIFILVATALLAVQRKVANPVPGALRRTAVYWFVFVFFAAITLPRVKLPLSASRVLLEAFIFPAILAWFVLRYFEVRKNLCLLHVCTCVMAIYVAGVGLAEVVLQRDLMALPSSSVVLAGEDPTAQFLVRPNGPFSSTNSFALVGLVSFFFIHFLKKAITGELPLWQRMLHRLGMTAALATALMPLFRSVITSLFVVFLVDAYYQRGTRRWARVSVMLGLLSGGLVLYMALPGVFEERSSSGNFYGRIAEQKQVLLMFMDHPLTGVGFANFYEAAQHSRYVAAYQGVESVDAEHNNLSAILSETGLVGFIPYVVSQLLLIGCYWKLRAHRTEHSELVWTTFLFIFLVYWVNGMSLASGFYADLNLWYMFALAVLYKFAATAPPETEGVNQPVHG